MVKQPKDHKRNPLREADKYARRAARAARHVAKDLKRRASLAELIEGAEYV